MKVIIAGSRSFNDYPRLSRVLAMIPEITEVVCGEARGADSLGRQWAQDHYIPVKSFPAQWNKYGRSAGHIRNREMGDYADYLVAFWDGKSKGTKGMINYMKSLGKHGRVEIFNAAS